MPYPTTDPSRPQRPTLFSYTIREQIAAGGMSTVYRARHPNGNLAAIKVVQLDLNSAAAQSQGKAILREMRIHETLKHQAVLEMIGGEMREQAGAWPSGLYLLLALGEPLSLRCRSRDALTDFSAHAFLPIAPPPADGGDLFDKISESAE